jgi:tRNA threonylcarbamoyladenosine biosynthesis protein TsaB
MILAIETATEVCSTALVHQNKVLSKRSVREKNIHSERLLMLIEDVLQESRVQKQQVECIAVSIGPGSFTGLRIGLSTAKGLALALHLPILAIPTLDGIAESFRLSHRTIGEENFCSLIDAKRDEAFYAFYSITKNNIERRSDFSIKLKADIISEAKDQNASIAQPDISAGAVGLLADREREKFIVSDFSYLEPLYLRDFVATLPKKKI